jgi:hypothetical protein
MVQPPPALRSSTSVLEVRRAWRVLLRYSRAMLAGPALGSTNMFSTTRQKRRRITAARLSRIRSQMPDGGGLFIAFLRVLRKRWRWFCGG